ncbi:MAG: PH domain-containing protein [Candidatus Solibacter sp.]
MHAETITFAAPWDNPLRVFTPLICALVLALALFMPATIPLQWVVKGILLMTLLGIWAWAPRAYRMERNHLIVQRLIGDVRIPFTTLRRVRIMSPDETRGAVRIWAVGSCFGYFGRFLNGTETQTWYVTDTEKCIRLECSPHPIVISPADPEALISALPLSLQRSK